MHAEMQSVNSIGLPVSDARSNMALHSDYGGCYGFPAGFIYDTLLKCLGFL